VTGRGQLGTGLVRKQDRQGSKRQDVLGCTAKYHLSQSALRIGTLDQKGVINAEVPMRPDPLLTVNQKLITLGHKLRIKILSELLK